VPTENIIFMFPTLFASFPTTYLRFYYHSDAKSENQKICLFFQKFSQILKIYPPPPQCRRQNLHILEQSHLKYYHFDNGSILYLQLSAFEC
jgi:hypothetical protein